MPKDLAEAPQLFFGNALYLNAWFDLDFERDAANFEPIKRSSCFQYAHDYDFDDWQTEDLWYYIARMDRAALKYRKAVAPKRKEPDAPPRSKVRKSGR